MKLGKKFLKKGLYTGLIVGAAMLAGHAIANEAKKSEPTAIEVNKVIEQKNIREQVYEYLNTLNEEYATRSIWSDDYEHKIKVGNYEISTGITSNDALYLEIKDLKTGSYVGFRDFDDDTSTHQKELRKLDYICVAGGWLYKHEISQKYEKLADNILSRVKPSLEKEVKEVIQERIEEEKQKKLEREQEIKELEKELEGLVETFN